MNKCYLNSPTDKPYQEASPIKAGRWVTNIKSTKIWDCPAPMARTGVAATIGVSGSAGSSTREVPHWSGPNAEPCKVSVFTFCLYLYRVLKKDINKHNAELQQKPLPTNQSNI